MAFLYLVARKEPLEVSNDLAQKIKADWLSGKLPDVVDIPGITTFQKHQLMRIEFRETIAEAPSKAKQIETARHEHPTPAFLKKWQEDIKIQMKWL